MELKNLNTFIQVANYGSFTKAAEALGYTQSTISFQIRQLEEELNCQLFDRINHTISLTDKGQKLLQFALNILESTQQFSEDFNKENSAVGEIRLGTADSICEELLSLKYQDFYSQYPNIQLNFSTGNTDALMEMLDSNKVDAILTIDNHVYRNDYIIAKEKKEDVHFVASANSKWANKKNISIEDILNEPFMLTEKGMSYRKILDEKLAASNYQIDPILEIGRTDIIVHCLTQSNAIAFLPDFTTLKARKEGSIVILDVKDFEISVWKQLIYHRNKWVSQALDQFISYVAANEFE